MPFHNFIIDNNIASLEFLLCCAIFAMIRDMEGLGLRFRDENTAYPALSLDVIITDFIHLLCIGYGKYKLWVTDGFDILGMIRLK